jgi:hypothetical protein
VAIGETEELQQVRLEHIIAALTYCNLYRQRFDLTTFNGGRYLDCTVPGEFATHLHCAYRPEVLAYRLGRIPIKPREEDEIYVALGDIWIVNPIKPSGISDEDVAGADVSQIGPEMRRAIREGFHCKDKQELDYFLRRYLAS